jgi:transcriptional regulator with XRE-family HTH domain
MDQQKIGRYIAERRKALGLTQAQLAQQLGVTDKSVSKWERGVCLPDVSLYQPLCKILGITFSEFFSGEPAEHPIDASIAEKTILAVAEDGEARRKKYNRIITILVVIGLLLSASLFYAMRQTVRDPLSFKDHIRQSQLEPSQWQMVHMLSGRNSAFPYDFSYKQDLPWLSFIIREYRQGELINETMVGAVHVGEVRDPKKNKVTGSIVLLLDKNAGELTLSVSDTKGGVYSFNGVFEPLPEGQSLDVYPQLGGSVLEADREIQLVGYAYREDGSGQSIVPADSMHDPATEEEKLQNMDYYFSLTCCFGEKLQ